MLHRHKLWIIVIGALLYLPSWCFANPVAPFPFDREGFAFVVFLFAFSLVLLAEALILKCFMRDYPYRRHLHLAFYPNILSSAVGSVLYKVWSIDFFSFWEGYFLKNTLLLLIFFLVAVFVEFPVVRYLYLKRISTSRALGISFAMNLFSYCLLLLALEFFLEVSSM